MRPIKTKKRMSGIVIAFELVLLTVTVAGLLATLNPGIMFTSINFFANLLGLGPCVFLPISSAGLSLVCLPA